MLQYDSSKFKGKLFKRYSTFGTLFKLIFWINSFFRLGCHLIALLLAVGLLTPFLSLLTKLISNDNNKCPSEKMQSNSLIWNLLNISAYLQTEWYSRLTTCSDSIKPSLQFLCYFVVIDASEGSLCFQNFECKISNVLIVAKTTI
jgi:hypothetical protein